MASKSSSARSTSKSAPRSARGPRTRRSKIWRVVRWFLALGLVGVLVAVLAFVLAYRAIDIPDPNADFLTETSFIYYADGESELGRFATQERESISYDEMPATVRNAVVAAEDQTFWTNEGIDPKGILRAAFSNASGNETQGASTITQQYVKVLYLTQEQTWKRKLKEAILSLKVQRSQSKTEVLEGYLNTIYFGRGAYGIEAAAHAFFDKPAGELDLRESAVLASVINNPSLFDPANGKDNRRELKGRYGYVLGNMAEAGDLSAAQAEQAAKRLPPFPEIEEDDAYGGQRGHMLTLVREELRGLGFSDSEIDGQGLRVTTTFSASGDGGRQAGRRGGATRGVQRQGAARRGRLRRARDGRPARLLRRPGLPRLADQLGHRRRHGRVDDEARHPRHGARERLLAGRHLRGQLAL